MPRFRTIQQRFTQGELDPKMLARFDVDQYYGAAEKLTNCFPIPQGGFRRRPGLEHIERVLRQITRHTGGTITCPNGGTTSNANDDNIATEVVTTTGISTTNGYVVVSYDMGSSQAVGLVRVKGLKLSAGTSSEFYIQTSTNGTDWTSQGEALSLTTSDKEFTRRVQSSVRYVRLARVGTTNLGTATVTLDEFNIWIEGSLSATRLIDFEFNTGQTYILLLTDKNIAVYRNGEYKFDIYNADLTQDVIPFVNWTQSGDSLVLVEEDLKPKLVQRGTSDDVWTIEDITFDFIPTYDFVPSVTAPATTLATTGASGTVTLTAGSAQFSAADVGQYIEGNGGIARIISYTSTTVVKAFLEVPFFDNSTIASGDWQILRGYEDVWSTTRGWPRTAMFYEGRLYFGGSALRPRTIWASRVNNVFSFDPGAALDDDAFEREIGGGKLNAITALYDGRSLMVFTTGGEFVAQQTLGEPLTPKNAAFKRQTSIGSRDGIRPHEVEGNVYFCQREGSSINTFVFTDTQQAFTSPTASLLSSHLIKEPVDMSLRRATSTSEGSYLLIVNNDGTLTVGNILVSQAITSFAPQTTDGSFKNCAVDINDMYFVVDRTINGVQNYWLERFNDDCYMDASTLVTTGLPAATFTGLTQLEAKACRVRADGSIMADRTVSGGSVTIERNAEDSFEIGINYTPLAKDLPVEVSQLGTTIDMKKNISKVTLQVYETSGLTVNGKSVSFRGFGPAGGGSPLDTTPPLYSGIVEVHGIRGWTDTGQVEISQVDPQPMTVLALSKKVNV